MTDAIVVHSCGMIPCLCKSGIDRFMDEYAPRLAADRDKNPDDFGWGPDLLPVVLERMRAALIRGSFNKDSRAMRSACKALGIKHTYGDIAAFVRG